MAYKQTKPVEDRNLRQPTPQVNESLVKPRLAFCRIYNADTNTIVGPHVRRTENIM
jgi:hypothetical protein